MDIDAVVSNKGAKLPGRSGKGMRIERTSRLYSLYLYTFSEGHIDKKLPRELIEERLAWNVLRILHQALYSNVEILPTERNTLITFQFNSLEKSLITGNVEKEDRNNRPFSVPVSHYLRSAITAYGIGIKHKTNRAKNAKNIPAISEYIRLSQLLEEQILGGKVDFSHTDPEPNETSYSDQLGALNNTIKQAYTILDERLLYNITSLNNAFLRNVVDACYCYMFISTRSSPGIITST
jgi:hypothetical protein